jgi:hypothetical protein
MFYEETIRSIESSGHSVNDIDFASIVNMDDWDNDEAFYYDSSEEFNKRAGEELSIEYAAGYGSQLFGGVIVFKDGSWLERREYDGSEWWEFFKTPQREKFTGGQE